MKKFAVILLSLLCAAACIGIAACEKSPGGIEMATVTLSEGEGYTLSGRQSVAKGMDYKFRVVFAEGYEQDENFSVTSNGKAVTETEGDSYVVRSVTENIAIAVSGVKKTVYSVTYPESESFSVSGDTSVEYGNSLSFGIDIANGFETGVDFAVYVNGEEISGTGLHYSIPSVKENIVVQVAGVYAVKNENGPFSVYKYAAPASIESLSAEPVAKGSDYRFSVDLTGLEKTDGFAVYVNGILLQPSADGTYTVQNVSGDLTVYVTGVKEARRYIQFEGEGFTAVSVNGPQWVLSGEDFRFRIRVDAAYEQSADSVTVQCGGETLVPAGDVYTLENVTQDKTVTVGGLSLNTYTVHFEGCELADETVTHGEQAVSVPQRSGYEFIGWRKNGQNFDGAITEDTTLTARWGVAAEDARADEKTIFSYAEDDAEGVVERSSDYTAQRFPNKTISGSNEVPQSLGLSWSQGAVYRSNGYVFIYLPKINYAAYGHVAFKIFSNTNRTFSRVEIAEYDYETPLLNTFGTDGNANPVYEVIIENGVLRLRKLSETGAAEDVGSTYTLTEAENAGTENLVFKSKIDSNDEGYIVLSDLYYYLLDYSSALDEFLGQLTLTGRESLATLAAHMDTYTKYYGYFTEQEKAEFVPPASAAALEDRYAGKRAQEFEKLLNSIEERMAGEQDQAALIALYTEYTDFVEKYHMTIDQEDPVITVLKQAIGEIVSQIRWTAADAKASFDFSNSNFAGNLIAYSQWDAYAGSWNDAWNWKPTVGFQTLDYGGSVKYFYVVFPKIAFNDYSEVSVNFAFNWGYDIPAREIKIKDLNTEYYNTVVGTAQGSADGTWTEFSTLTVKDGKLYLNGGAGVQLSDGILSGEEPLILAFKDGKGTNFNFSDFTCKKVLN